MSRFFTPSDDGWEIETLEAARYRVLAAGGGNAPRVLALADGATAPAEALLVRVPAGPGAADAGWAVLAGRGARVLLNGEPLALGVALLRHRDELRVGGGEPFYFSTERLAAVEPCARDDAPRCPRCAQPIARGEPAVRCPGCGVLHHQLPERKCWTHLPSCAICGQTTDFETGLRWSPEVL